MIKEITQEYVLPLYDSGFRVRKMAKAVVAEQMFDYLLSNGSIGKTHKIKVTITSTGQYGGKKKEQLKVVIQ